MPKEPAEPRCNRCKQAVSGGMSQGFSTFPNGVVISLLWCSNCGEIYNTQFVGQQKAPESLIKPIN